MYIEKDNLYTSIKSNFINTWTCNTLLESPCTYFNIFEFLHISQIGISVKNCTIDWCFIRFLIQNFFKLSLKTENFHLMYHYINECLAHAVTIQMLSFNPNLIGWIQKFYPPMNNECDFMEGADMSEISWLLYFEQLLFYEKILWSNIKKIL